MYLNFSMFYRHFQSITFQETLNFFKTFKNDYVMDLRKKHDLKHITHNSYLRNEGSLVKIGCVVQFLRWNKQKTLLSAGDRLINDTEMPFLILLDTLLVAERCYDPRTPGLYGRSTPLLLRINALFKRYLLFGAEAQLLYFWNSPCTI